MTLGQWHQTKGHNEIMRPYLCQKKVIRVAVWRPIIAFLICMVFGGMLISSVCDYFGVK